MPGGHGREDDILAVSLTYESDHISDQPHRGDNKSSICYNNMDDVEVFPEVSYKHEDVSFSGQKM